MKKEKSITKCEKTIRIFTIILAIVLITMIGFFGIYIPKQNRMENIIKGYDLAMDLKGARLVSIGPEENKETIIKDAEGNEVEESTEELTDEQIKEKGYTKEEIDNNAGKMTGENFQKVKEIIAKRLQKMEIENYTIRLNEQTGEITVELEENKDTDSIVSNFGATGKFEIVDSETNEVLMNNEDIDKVNVLYNSTETGTNVYLDIAFNKEGKGKLQEISSTYVEKKDAPEDESSEENSEEDTQNEQNKTEDAEANGEEGQEENSEEEKKKQIIMKIDGEDIMTTAFDEVITTGKLGLTVGQASTDTETIEQYAQRAQTMATILSYGNLPLDYEVTNNEFIISDIENKDIENTVIIIIGIAIIGLIYLMIKYKFSGILGSFSYIGFSALLLIIIRYTNVVLSIDSILGIIAILISNYVLIKIILNTSKQSNNKEIQKQYAKFFVKIIPICIMTIVFCFIKWIPISSFGMIMFWGILLMSIYNYIVTLPLLRLKENKE